MKTEASNPLTEELIGILRAVAIVSPQSFAFAGRVIQANTSQNQPPTPGPWSPAVAGVAGDQWQQGAAQQPLIQNSKLKTQNSELPNHLILQLQQYLYQYCYCTGLKKGFPEELPAVDFAAQAAFVQSLSAANSSADRWDEGWRMHSMLPTGQVLAEKGALLKAVWPGEFLVPGGAGMAPMVGSPLSLYLARESTVMQPGFYFAFGEAPADWQDDSSIVRFYWNISADGAPLLMKGITARLNSFRVPFRFKSLTYPASYLRRDAAVLFVARRYYTIAAELAARVHDDVRDHLGEDTPLMTRRLARGLGFAEDPGLAESFGTSRCKILAEGLWSAYISGHQSEPARLQAVRDQFERYGIDMDRPYLNPGSTDRYTFPGEEWTEL